MRYSKKSIEIKLVSVIKVKARYRPHIPLLCYKGRAIHLYIGSTTYSVKTSVSNIFSFTPPPNVYV